VNWSDRERRRLVESSLSVAQIDFSQPITSTEEGNRNKGNEEAFSSDQSAIAITEGEEIEPKTVKDAECQTIEFDFMFQTSRYQAPSRYQGPSRDIFLHWRYSSLLHWATVYGNTNGCMQACLLTCHTANTVAQRTFMKFRLNAPL